MVSGDFSMGAGDQIACFRPGALFGLSLWESNHYGTTRWHLYICRSLGPGEPGYRVPQVSPGADVLLHARNKTHVKHVLRWLQDLGDQGIDPCRLPVNQYLIADMYLKSGAALR